MQRLRGHLVRVEHVTVGGRDYAVLAPEKGEALLDDPRVIERFEREEYLPYWAMLWPAALLLADAVATWEEIKPGEEEPSVFELGCGLGLVGLVATSLGYRVTVSDHDADALEFVRASAERNSLPPPATRNIDWHDRHEVLNADRIVAADVLYEARNLRPIGEFVRRHLNPGGFALISDPNRRTADAFELTARECRLWATVSDVTRPAGKDGIPITGRIFCLRRDTLRPH